MGMSCPLRRIKRQLLQQAVSLRANRKPRVSGAFRADSQWIERIARSRAVRVCLCSNKVHILKTASARKCCEGRIISDQHLERLRLRCGRWCSLSFQQQIEHRAIGISRLPGGNVVRICTLQTRWNHKATEYLNLHITCNMASSCGSNNREAFYCDRSDVSICGECVTRESQRHDGGYQEFPHIPSLHTIMLVESCWLLNCHCVGVLFGDLGFHGDLLVVIRWWRRSEPRSSPIVLRSSRSPPGNRIGGPVQIRAECALIVLRRQCTRGDLWVFWR